MTASAEQPAAATLAAPSAADKFPFSCTERVRWEDVDLAGIVRYSAYTRMLDVAEQEMWRTVGLSAVNVVERFGIWLPRRALQVEFHAPARYDDLLELRVGVAAVGNSSLTILVDAWSADGAVHHATVRVVLVAVEAELMHPRPIPEEIRRLIGPLRMDG